jgi:hypothetical protein
MNAIVKKLTNRKMKPIIHFFKIASMLLTIGLSVILVGACDDEEPSTLPTVTTGTVQDITTTSVSVSGEIADDGNAAVIATGFVYSSIVAEPTLADEKVELTDTEKNFSATLTGLHSGTAYHLRAYVTNSVGTAYGQTVDFTTGNAPPEATNVSVTGQAQVNQLLTATYVYHDAEGDAQGATTFQWYVANDGAGASETPIADATANTFSVQEAQTGKFIRVGVKPKALSGTDAGAETKSGWVGAVGEATTVTFTYNNQEVTYGILTSAATGRKWLDRNLGATNAPTAYNDFANYGDLFQWGRRADGHQLVNRTGATTADVTGSGTTTTLSDSDTPPHASFIVNGSSPADWRIPQNANLWQGVNGINNPCPPGWRIPTKAEWEAELIIGGTPLTIAQAYERLKLTLGGFRTGITGAFQNPESSGRYWSSTMGGTSTINPVRFSITPTLTSQTADFRAHGMMCRCTKD